jgi:pimeloyl-ACP methyl ester carboxylesterase
MASVVFASGQLLTQAVWAPQLAALANQHELVLSDHTLDDTVAGFAQRLLASAPERFHLVAHAMGGFTAFEVMRRAPNRVQSLVLIATLAANDGPPQTERRRGYLRLVEAGRFEQVIEERLPILVHPARREDDPLLGLVRRMAAETGPDTFMRQQRAIMSRPDSRPTLPKLTAPTLVARGAHDGITTLAQQEEMLGLLPNARFVELEHCGHLPTLEMPHTTSGLLAGWFAEHA